jgi:hypothetical protein
MRTLVLLCGTLAAMVLISSANSPAQARDFGFHISGPGYHVDFGRPHARTAYYGSYYGGHGGYHDHHYRGRRTWHDTSHYDYHPGEFVRHRNHYHYVPGHYDYHEDGHWDHW